MKLVTPSGAEYRLTKGANLKNRLPKKPTYVVPATVTAKAVVEVAEGGIPVTSNRAWAGEAAAIEYLWFLIDGRTFYATLDPGMPAKELEGSELAIVDGVATRVNPKRETTRVETERARIEAFRATWAANRGEKVEEPTPEPVAEPVEMKKRVKAK